MYASRARLLAMYYRCSVRPCAGPGWHFLTHVEKFLFVRAVVIPGSLKTVRRVAPLPPGDSTTQAFFSAGKVEESFKDSLGP